MSTAQHAYRNSYETRWSRVKRGYYRNEFLAPRITADDREYLERFLKHGPITMETVNTRTGFLLEELGFWHQPYGVDVTVERKVGPAVEEPIIPDADGAADKARRVRDKRGAKLARETMKSEHEQWQAEREKRRLQQKQADAEWEKARAEAFSPYAKELELREKYRPLSSRHYVPNWQLEEIAAAELSTAEAKAKQLEAEAKQLEEAARLDEERAALKRMAGNFMPRSEETKRNIERSAKQRARDQRRREAKKRISDELARREETGINLALEAEQREIERIEREAIEAARRVWEKERGIGGELEAIFDEQPRPPEEDE